MVEGNCIVLGIRVVIPQKYTRGSRGSVNRHPGIQRLGAMLGGLKLTGILSIGQKAFTACKGVKQAPAVAPLHPHKLGKGFYWASSYLIVVDAHKWPKVCEMKTTKDNSSKHIKCAP